MSVTDRARRAMEVCNACRYCEGFCAVFPAMTLRREFSDGDLTYLANLCHGCNGCYYACQYAPPHEFGVNVPVVFAELRAESYARHAWPEAAAVFYRRNGQTMALAMAGGVTWVLILSVLLMNWGVLFGVHPVTPGAGFYQVIPYPVMLWTASVMVCAALVALGMGFVRYWRVAGGWGEGRTWQTLRQALHDAATLRYLGGGGGGCNDVGEKFTMVRRRLHHAMAYGFLLCLAATSVGAVYDRLLGWQAPYGFFSLPVLLGVAGGVGMLVGCSGLLWAKLAGDQETRARQLLGAETGLLMLLLMIAATGLLLLAVRASGVMGVMLAVHLGFVLALFVMLPYSKFVHALYRFGALVRHAGERPDA